MTVNVFRQRINQLFQGVEDIWRGIAKHSQWVIAISDYPPIPSQGKNLNILKGDLEVLPKGDRIALPTGDREAIQETAHSQLYTESNPVLNFYESKTKKIRSRILLSHYNQM
ncbi:hypothetical protein [Cylindrospermopsis raciborskii]|uniref:hypothetical protein n=1 Tax=Cylindrospermopsis raciborskii TaxID=77022 RepID=UPI0021551DB4|nr:hypothetical protein [Cylindrospermopsis raciborskii]